MLRSNPTPRPRLKSWPRLAPTANKTHGLAVPFKDRFLSTDKGTYSAGFRLPVKKKPLFILDFICVGYTRFGGFSVSCGLLLNLRFKVANYTCKTVV